MGLCLQCRIPSSRVSAFQCRWGASASSNWTPGQGLQSASSSVTPEVVLGEIADAGVSAGIGGLSSCQGGRGISFNLGLGRYGGVQLNFKGGKFDGISFGLGVGVSLPVSLTISPPGK